MHPARRAAVKTLLHHEIACMTRARHTLTWSEHRHLVAADRARYAAWREAAGPSASNCAMFDPSFLCVWLYRLSSYLFRGGHRWLARAVWHCNLLLTGADIAPNSVIGPGFVVVHPVSVTVIGQAGRNFTVVGHGGMGAGMERVDIGAGLGLPVLGDDIVLPMKAGVLGPVRVGDRVKLFPGCIVTRDLPADAELVEVRPAVLKASAPAAGEGP